MPIMTRDQPFRSEEFTNWNLVIILMDHTVLLVMNDFLFARMTTVSISTANKMVVLLIKLHSAMLRLATVDEVSQL